MSRVLPGPSVCLGWRLWSGLKHRLDSKRLRVGYGHSSGITALDKCRGEAARGSGTSYRENYGRLPE